MRWPTGGSAISPASAALLLLGAIPRAEAAYSLQTLYQGESFFNGWSFWGNRDNLTNGAVYYVGSNEAARANVAYTNAAGNVILKADNTSTLAIGGLRNSVRITTQETYDIGSLFVMDAYHVPFGCAVWPAFWTHTRSWPSGGEQDIFEGVNLASQNQAALHTVVGCTVANTTTNVTQTGTLTYDNCDYSVAAKHGCTYTDSRNQSYGQPFADGGGGMYVAETSSDAISMWFFPRANIPADLLATNGTPDPKTWGLPWAYYPSSSCNINQYFAPQQITINIALCGDWAGQPGVFSPSCGTGSCANYVLDPSNFDDAYFEIASVRVYGGGLNTRGALSSASGVIGGIGGSQTRAPMSGARLQSSAGLMPVFLVALVVATLTQSLF
ncbi:hypothetical protein C6P46_003278 [Rhodotorula mucilaginosa]|uniref:GH16 domain-containing protein n=1 Tax=Rhodotorula mucilaginosa TaxID=5537 RepID=A0A9P6W588_RHOMI|nr:hypothetical protein C6P46_003278 [Rhodotorula mucilaginosa]